MDDYLTIILSLGKNFGNSERSSAIFALNLKISSLEKFNPDLNRSFLKKRI